MSLLIATPCYGGMATVHYFKGLLATQDALLQSGMDFDILVTEGESLITRARNTTAATFLGSGYQKLLFIDADIEFSPDDVARLYNHDLPVVAAAYPWKQPGKPVTAWQGGELRETAGMDGLQTVDYAGTGFMMIDRGALESLQACVVDYEEGVVGRCWDFFGTYVTAGANWRERCFLSEDYAFCQRWRDMGGDVWLDPAIRLKHHGAFAYDGA